MHRAVHPRGRNDHLVVDQQEAAILAGGHEPVGRRRRNPQVSAVAAEERGRRQGKRVVRVLHARPRSRPRSAWPRRTPRGPPGSCSGCSSLNWRVSSSSPSWLVHAGTASGAGRLAAVEDLVGVLPLHRLEGQPAIVARPKLQDARGDRLLALGRYDRDVAAVVVDLPVMEELGDHDRVRLAGRDGHRADGVELRSRAAEGSGRKACRPGQPAARGRSS